MLAEKIHLAAHYETLALLARSRGDETEFQKRMSSFVVRWARGSREDEELISRHRERINILLSTINLQAGPKISDQLWKQVEKQLRRIYHIACRMNRFHEDTICFPKQPTV